MRRFEDRLAIGVPDLYFRSKLTAASGWVECKLFDREGTAPKHLSLGQVIWGETEAALPGGRWFLLARAGPAWLLYDAHGARRLYEGDESSTPLFRVTGRYPTKEMLQWLTR